MTRQAREQFFATLAMLLTLAAGGAFVGGLSGGLIVPIAAVLVMAYAKGRFVVLDFMELRTSRGVLKAALLAWPATVLAGSIAPLILVFGLVVHFVMDKMLVGPAGLPAWYLPLRLRLTLVACLCLLLNAWQGLSLLS